MSGYIGPIPVPQGIQNKETFTATAGQTTFNTNGYTDGDFINVYLNGVRLINGTDYTATNGSDIVLTTGASASDVLEFETFNEFSLASQQFENITLKNPTHEDTDGGRESAVSFKGEQSGGEISTLAQIQASHDGTSDDEKGDLIFRTNDGSDGSSPTERMRIDSGGNIGVNINAPSSMLHLFDGGTDTGITLQSKVQASATSSITFMSRDSSNVNQSAVLKNIDGRLQSSAGIMFGSDTAAENALDDYEEGTWTPAITGVTVTSGAFTGNYRKVGGMVTVTAYMENATLSGSGDTITGLPFTNSKRTSSSMPSLYNHQHGDKNFNILLETNTTTAYMQYNGSGAWVSAPISAGSGRYMNFQITYCTAQ